MDADTNDASSNRPYPPPSNIVTVLQRLRQRNPPSKIDAEYLRDLQISEGTITRALTALRFLKIVEDDGTPLPVVRTIATSTDEEYKEILARLIREAYSDVFERLDPAEDTQDKFYNFFRRYTPASQRERMVIFFLGMCREAGIELADAPRARGTLTTSRSTPRQATPKAKLDSKGTAKRTGQNNEAGQTQDTSGIPPALLLLVKSLPPEGAALPAHKRSQWIEMAKATLAFVYPEEVEQLAGDDAEEAEDLA